MAKNLLISPRAMAEKSQMGIWDDFTWYVTAHNFTTTVSDSGTVAVGDAASGIVVLTPSDGSVGDNDEAYLKSTNELFKLAAGRTIFAECLLQFTEANTDDANVAFGLQNAVGANSIIDDGAGLKVTGDTICIYKVDGGTVWKCVTVVNGGTAIVSTTTATAGGSAYQKLGIEIADVDGTNVEVTFFLDGRPLLDSTFRRPIKHTFALASATEMQVWAGVKNGFTNLETLNVDYIAAFQSR